MRRLLKKIAALGLTAAMILPMAACGSGGSGGEKDSHSDTLKTTISIAYDAQPNTYDPHASGATAVAQVATWIFEKLFELDSEGTPKCQLCESYTSSSDNTEWTFKLRSGVKFHNGETMDADDVVASMNRWYSKSSIAQKAIQTTSKFEKVDDLTVKIKLDSPCLLLPYIIANDVQMASILPKSVLDEAGTSNLSVDQLIGTSSLKFSEWAVDSYIKLEKFEDYTPFTEEYSGDWGNKTVYFDTAMIYIVSDPTTRANGLETGEYDISYAIQNADVARVNAMSNATVYSETQGDMTITMNKSEGALFNDYRWRQVIGYAVDIAEMMEAAYPTIDGNCPYIVDGSYFETDSPWHTDVSDSVKQDITKAKELLAELNYDGTPIRLLTTETYPHQYNSALVMKQQLEAIGLKVDLQVYEWGTLLTKIGDKTAYDLYPMSYPIDDNPASKNYIRKTTTSGFTNDAQLDEYILEMNSKTSMEEAQKYWKETVQPYCVDKMFIIHLGEYKGNIGVSTCVENFDYYHNLQLRGLKFYES
ncbi:MAG: ABC transporter substrate-binding protein [Lachnospira sp.]